MKRLLFLGALILTYTGYGQLKDSMNINYYGWAGLSPNGFFSAYCYGASIHIDKNVLQAGLHTYKELSFELFPEEKPYRVGSSKTFALIYGYKINIIGNGLSFIPSIGLGYTRLKYRTGQNDSNARGGTLGLWPSPAYVTEDHSGLSLIGNLELIAPARFVGASFGYMPHIFISNLSLSTHQVYARICIGKTK